jgi:hypothetical protein
MSRNSGQDRTYFGLAFVSEGPATVREIRPWRHIEAADGERLIDAIKI